MVDGVNTGKLLLSPTRTYAPVIRKILDNCRDSVHGLVHCSGGGQTKVLHFIDKLHVVKDNLFPVPPLFRLIQEQSGTDWKEMYRVFNMGHRMELYVPGDIVPKLIEIAASFNLEAKVVGRVKAQALQKLTIVSGHGTFNY